MDKREIAEKKIQCLDQNVLQVMRMFPTSLTYMALFRVLQELHFQGEYDLVIGICDVWEEVSRQKCRSREQGEKQ